MQNGALLINKHEGISSFGVIEALQKQWMARHQVRKREVPKLGHGGTLDPFATGLLIVCAGRAVKLARYFLSSAKEYRGVIKFGETTVPGDPTAPVSETSSNIPSNREQIQALATTFTLQPYLQTPPMFSAKKRNGKPLYELARKGIEVERQPKVCQLYSFEILDYDQPRASFRVLCSSGTYIRTLAQDIGKTCGSVALLEKLERTASGLLRLDQAWTLAQIEQATQEDKRWEELPCWVPFDRLLDTYDRAEATEEEARSLQEGRQNVLFNILKRGVRPVPSRHHPPTHEDYVAIYCRDRLIAVANKTRNEGGELWGLERVFVRGES